MEVSSQRGLPAPLPPASNHATHCCRGWLVFRVGQDNYENRKLLSHPRFEVQKITLKASNCLFFTEIL